jgi:hypothetical protein
MTRLMQHGRTILVWALATVRATLPPAVRNLGRHPDARLYRMGAGDSLAETGLRYRSILGETSLGERVTGQEIQAVQIELPEADQYRRILSVSDNVARRGRAALELRLNEFSPIPVEQAQFAYRLLSPQEAGGYQVEVSVVRRSRLDEAMAARPANARSWSIVGDVDESGRAGFEYAGGTAARRRGQIGPGPRLVVVVSACVLVCLAWADRYSRQSEMLELRRSELIEIAHGLRDADTAIERADRARQAGAPTVPLGRVVAALRELGERAPEGLAIETLALDAPGSLVIDGPGMDAGGMAVNIRLEVPLEDAQ